MQNEHLSERDLLNFAKDKLGERKKNRLLEHAKGCGYCADRLLEAVREHAPPPGPVELSWWNWASIGLFVVLLVVLVVLFVWFLRQAPPEPPDPPGVPEQVPGQEQAGVEPPPTVKTPAGPSSASTVVPGREASVAW